MLSKPILGGNQVVVFEINGNYITNFKRCISCLLWNLVKNQTTDKLIAGKLQVFGSSITGQKVVIF